MRELDDKEQKGKDQGRSFGEGNCDAPIPEGIFFFVYMNSVHKQ